MMKWLILFLTALVASAEVIPADRTITWSANVNVGVVGGIPYRTTIFTNVVTAGADNTGVTDASLVIQTNIDSCPSNEVVYIPAGTYLIQNPLVINGRWDKGITIRGDGTNTILVGDIPYASSVIELGTSWPEDYITSAPIIAKGSSNVAVLDATGITEGSMLRIVHDVNDLWVRSAHMFQGVQVYNCYVQAVDGTNLTVWPPSFWNFTNSTVNVTIGERVLIYSGIEDLKIKYTNAAVENGIKIEKAVQCWVTGVESENTPRRHIYGYDLAGCTIKSNYLHGAFSFGPDQGNGIHIYKDSTGVLIEDNILVESAIVLMQNTSGSVCGYNFLYKSKADGFPYQYGVFNINHGPHNMMNLIEGNVCEQIQSDGYYGGASHNTLYRNYFNTSHPLYDGNQKAIDLCRWSYFFNAVGNVLGHPGMGGFYQMETLNYDYSSNVIYRLGYPQMAANSFNGTNFPDGKTLTNYALPSVETNWIAVTNVGYGPEMVGAGNELGAVSTWLLLGNGTPANSSFYYAGAESPDNATSVIASNLYATTYAINFDYLTGGGFFGLYVDGNQVFITDYGETGSYSTNITATNKIEFVMDSDDGDGGWSYVILTNMSIQKLIYFYNGTNWGGIFTNITSADEVIVMKPDLTFYYNHNYAAADGTDTNLIVTTSGYVTNDHLVFRLFPDETTVFQQLDLNVTNTLLRTCNFDYVNNTNIIDPAITDTNLIASLYLPSKPGWFGTNAYPPLDPFTPSTNWIPAQVRYWGTGIAEPSAPVGLKMKLRAP